MNIEVGQWYRCRDEKFVAHIVGPIRHRKYEFAAVVYRQGEFEHTACFTASGSFSCDRGERLLDLVEHLPDCDGPNWKPEKWRKATPEDALTSKRCRVNGGYSVFEGNVAGFRKDSQSLRFCIYVPGQTSCWYDSDDVEVLDD